MSSSPRSRCRVCGNESTFAFTRNLIGHHVAYFDCGHCGYFQTEAPYWLAEAYASPINDVDTGILWRNQLNVRRVLMTLAAFGQMSARVVDHAGGYGILVRLLRDSGVDAYWRDKYCQNLLARGFEADDRTYDLLTAFEVFEHLEDPLSDLRKMLATAPVVLLSTELIDDRQTPAPDWWYLGPEHGQHVGFLRIATLAWIAQKLGCHHATDGVSLHVFAKVPVPRRWSTLVKLGRLAPLLARFTLRSKMLDDFNLLRERP